jgi:anti-anti-sigma factor
MAPSPVGLGAGDHVCWVFDAPGDLLDAMQAFLWEGLALGQRLVVVGSRGRTDVLDELSALGDLQQLTDRGALEVIPVDELGSGAAAAIQGVCERAMRPAIEGGYTGLRMVVDTGSAAATEHGRAERVRIEQAVDRIVARYPVTALCVFDAALGRPALAELACVHPRSNRPLSEFHLFCDQRERLVLTGEVDAFSSPLLAETLRRIDGGRGSLVLDVSGLDFIDGAGLATLHRHTRSRGGQLVLLRARPIVVRLVELLGLQDVCFEWM